MPSDACQTGNAALYCVDKQQQQDGGGGDVIGSEPAATSSKGLVTIEIYMAFTIYFSADFFTEGWSKNSQIQCTLATDLVEKLVVAKFSTKSGLQACRAKEPHWLLQIPFKFSTEMFY